MAEPIPGAGIETVNGVFRMAHQCPYCPLLFTYASELDVHRRDDHRSRNIVPDEVVVAPARPSDREPVPTGHARPR